MTRRERFALACLAAIAAGATTGSILRPPPPEPEPRCTLDRLERLPGAPQLALRGKPIMGGGLYEFWTCDGHAIRTWVGP